ncbi:MAG: hypothetical protein AAB565_01185 [Patescibacteria group bacterium]
MLRDLKKSLILKYLKKIKFLNTYFLALGIITTIFLISGFAGISPLSDKVKVLGQGIPLFYFPNFPIRLAFLANEITTTNEELIIRSDELSKFVNAFDCKYAQSQCVQTTKKLPGGGQQSICEPGPIKVFGRVNPIPQGTTNEKEVHSEEIQSAINDLNIKLASLQTTLRGEVEIGIEKQLKTLRPEDAQIIRDNLEKLDRLMSEMRNLTERNSSLPNKCSVQRCTPECELGQTFTAEACVGASGEQKPIELKFKVGVGLDNLNLGRLGIENINLGLPDKVNIPTPQLPSLSFRIPNATLNCPTQRQQIVFHPSTPILPDLPTITLSCPQYQSYSSYQCSSPPSQGEEGFIEFEWWNKTFEHLSGECLKVANSDSKRLKNEQGQIEYQKAVEGCMSPEKVVPTTINECEAKWVRKCSFLDCRWELSNPREQEICGQIGRSPDKTQKAVKWCQTLYQDEGQTPPATCSSETILTTHQKCNEIRNSGRENVPLSCKLLPLFAGQLEDLPEGTVIGQGGNCPSQNIGDFPIPMAGCAITAPSIPKITFPTIIIPDIHLPTFSLPPLFRVKLPNLIFEDLNIGEINLCNLDDCSAQFPYLTFKPPSLKIPQVNVPPVTLEIPGASPIDIQIEPINFQTLNFNIPQLINLGSLVTPELKIPEIPLPQPRIQFSFLGINIDLLNLLLGLFKTPLNLNQCVALDAKLGVLDIVYPDKYFPWPAYPKPGELKFCKKAREWCQRQKGSIQEITTKAARIQEQVNSVFQSEIQTKLDKTADRLNQKITREVERELEKVKNEISKQLLQHLGKYAPQNVIPPSAPVPGVWEVKGELPCQGIPPLTVYMPPDLQTISIDPQSINEFLEKEFGETWPTEITIRWPKDLKKFKLSCNESNCEACEQRGNDACRGLLRWADCPTLANWEDYAKCKLDYRINSCKNECKNCLSYDLPSVPLCGLSYKKEFTRRLPGHQLSVTTPRDLLSGLRNVRECISGPPKGGNPCQTEAGQIQANLNKIKRLSEEMKNASQEITNLLY